MRTPKSLSIVSIVYLVARTATTASYSSRHPPIVLTPMQVEEARKGQFPEPSALYEDIFAFGEKPKYIRAQEFHLSKYF